MSVGASYASKTVDQMDRRQKSGKGQKSPVSSHSHTSYNDQSKRDHTKATTTSAMKQYKSRRCGTTHEVRKCPAYGAACLKCNGRNHFRSQCKSKNVHEVSAHERKDMPLKVRMNSSYTLWSSI